MHLPRQSPGVRRAATATTAVPPQDAVSPSWAKLYCLYNGQVYGLGAQLCMNGIVKACNTGGAWLSMGRGCKK
jgi:hypothetical protein